MLDTELFAGQLIKSEVCKYHTGTQDVCRACQTEFAVRFPKVRVDRDAVRVVGDGKLSLNPELVR